MRNRPTAKYTLIAALFLSILTPMTGAHADGALDNTFGNGYPTDNGIFTQEGNGELFTIFNDVAAQLHFARFVDMAQNLGSGTDFTQQRQSEE